MKASRRRSPPPRASISPPVASPPPPGTLYVVATPIGNLEDITLRALKVLREVALVAAEDTRRTGNLLRHYQISTPLLSLHEHNERERVQRVRQELANGRSIALVSDAGTPAISDPGALLVHSLRLDGFKIEPVPGPSAVTAALSATGTEESGFAFLGFPPAAGSARKKWLDRLDAIPWLTVVLFEAPHRIRRLITELTLILGKHHIVVARELTKLHEEWLMGTPEELAGRLAEERGEYVVVIPARAPVQNRPDPPTDDEIGVLFGQITDSGTRRDAIRQTAERLGSTPKAVFAALERLKKP
jgi:16S rRNA (cytidine1402-2'-O)-methyltransferase